ncbi:hypothetical protein [Novipirellula sp.]
MHRLPDDEIRHLAVTTIPDANKVKRLGVIPTPSLDTSATEIA